MTAPKDIMDRASQAWQADDVAQKYSIAENATRPFADIMAQKAGFAKLEGEANVLDLACGTGAVTAAIYNETPKENWSQVKVLGGDVSEPMLQYLKARGEKAGWSGLETAIVDGKDIQLPKSTFTHVYISFAVFVLPPTTLSTCLSLLKPGGVVGVSSWSDFDWYGRVKTAISRLPAPQPTMPAYDDLVSKLYMGKAWNDTSFVSKTLEEAGFENVEVVKQRNRANCGTPAQFADTMWLPLNMISGYWHEEEERRVELAKAVQEELRKLASEEAGGDDKPYYMEMEGIVGVGKKPA